MDKNLSEICKKYFLWIRHKQLWLGGGLSRWGRVKRWQRGRVAPHGFNFTLNTSIFSIFCSISSFYACFLLDKPIFVQCIAMYEIHPNTQSHLLWNEGRAAHMMLMCILVNRQRWFLTKWDESLVLFPFYGRADRPFTGKCSDLNWHQPGNSTQKRCQRLQPLLSCLCNCQNAD